MPGHTETFVVGEQGADSPAVRQAAQILASGGLVAFPTETVYGIGADADAPDAIQRLRELKARPPGKPFSIHIADGRTLRKHVRRVPAVARKLTRKFWPGPLTIVFGRNEDAVGVRFPAHDVATAFIRAAGVTVVAPSANLAGRPPASTAEQVLEALDGRIDAVLDGGPAPLDQPSAVVQVWDTGWEMLRPGIITPSMIGRALKMHVLFICTGNSCRSPIAEALCCELLARRLHVAETDLPALGYDIASAGTATIGGGPASSSATDAADRAGLDLSGHRGQPLTVELLRNADKVYAMTSSHAESARTLCPSAADRVELLDPDGGDITDPIGFDAENFARVVDRMRRCIERRVKTL